MNLEYELGVEVISEIVSSKVEQRQWDVWLVRYQHMDSTNYESFEDFKNIGKIKYVEPKEQIIANANRIRRTVEEGEVGGDI